MHPNIYSLYDKQIWGKVSELIKNVNTQEVDFKSNKETVTIFNNIENFSSYPNLNNNLYSMSGTDFYPNKISIFDGKKFINLNNLNEEIYDDVCAAVPNKTAFPISGETTSQAKTNITFSDNHTLLKIKTATQQLKEFNDRSGVKISDFSSEF